LKAAAGLGMKDAAHTYRTRALDAAKAGNTCGGAFDTCEGFVVGEARP
jgi:hypothetical protein